MSTPLEQIVRTALLADAPFVATLGTDAGGNKALYEIQLPENPVYPAGVFSRVSDVPMYVQSPDTGQQASVGYVRMNFKFWFNGGNATLDRETLCRAFIAALGTFSAWQLISDPFLSAPNYVMRRHHGIEPETDPPLYFADFDVKIVYRNQ